jgi:hypothetical protein
MILKTADFESGLKNYLSESEYSLNEFLGFNDQTKTVTYCMVSLKNSIRTSRGIVKCIYLRGDGWYIQDLEIFKSSGEIRKAWRNHLFKI